MTGMGVKQGSGYRPEIDGLRAIAVVSVILYHINKTWLPGGYVGVDIFFVISGFLITSIIWRELQGGTFSLADFYLRRIRRIIPVMLVVVAATVLAGAFLLLPDALSRLSLSAIFSVASAANIYFWRYLDDDYFAEASDQEPLLHLWSLGVEEQFYLVWPLLLMLVTVVRRNAATVAIVLALAISVASFAVAEATNESNMKFSYFMLPARAGELMVGALLALALKRDGRARWLANPVAAELVAMAGLAAIGWSLFFLDDQSPFPGINAVYPCIGAALVILAGSDSRVLRWLLANRVMVWIGLLSYSLYLWHWPILAFIRYFFGAVGPMHAVAAVAVMLVLSVLSYRYVERPTRHVRWKGAKQVALLFVVPAACLLAPAVAVVASGGMKSWIEASPAYRDGLARLDASTAPAYRFEYNCQLSRHIPGILEDARCLVGAQQPIAPSRRILLWGDSHAAHHVGALAAIAESAGIRVRNATHSSCPPVFGGDYSYGNYKAGCTRFREYIREHIRSGEFDVVLMGATWTSYDREPMFRRDVADTVAEIRRSGATVVILGRVPYFASYNRECEMRWLRLGFTMCDQVVTANKPLEINNYLRNMAGPGSGITYLTLSDVICDGERCRAHMDGKPLYYDKSHLSMDGSRRLGEHMVSNGLASGWIAAMGGSPGSKTPASALPVRSRQAAADGFRASKLAAPLPEALELPFRYNRRFDNWRQMERNGSAERRVMVEYLGVSPEAVDEAMRHALVEKGFAEVRRNLSGKVLLLDYGRSDGVVVKLKISQGMLATAKAPDAVGTLHVTWRQGGSR